MLIVDQVDENFVFVDGIDEGFKKFNPANWEVSFNQFHAFASAILLCKFL
jgi:hypothetical protein